MNIHFNRVVVRVVFVALSLVVFPMSFIQAKEYHVSTRGDDSAEGTFSDPFLTVSHAAQIARPGDTVTVHEGIYREWINPAQGG